MFQSVGRFVDPTTVSRRLLAFTVLVTVAWSITWGWLVVIAAQWLIPKLWWLLGLLLALLSPRVVLPELYFLEPPPAPIEVVEVTVETDEMDLWDLEAAWEADEPVLTEDALADAEALWEAREAERLAAERRAEMAAVEQSGLLMAWVGSSAEIDGVFASALVLDDDAEYGIVGGLVGTSIGDGDSYGYGGLGARGSGLGGGGTAEGLGGLGTKGSGSGASGYGVAHGIGSTGGAKGGASLVSATPTALGPLSQHDITPVLSGHEAQLRYCYERELSRDPTLRGEITVRFVVEPDGSPSEVGVVRATLGSEAVRSCVVGRYARMQFPEAGEPSTVQHRLTFAPR